MSRAHGGQRSFFPMGNPFRVVFPKGSHLSPKLRALLAAYEEALASGLRRLKPEDAAEVHTLAWMRLAMDCLSQLHADVGTLITELELPVSDWDERWVDIYLNSSVKLLDICIALSSELSRLDQGQLHLRYTLHVLGAESRVLSSEKLKRAEASLQEWTERAGARCSRLEGCSTTLQELAGSLSLMKVKNSAKGKVLVRALYGLEAMTVFICSVLVALLLGSSKSLVELSVSEKFSWSQAFNDLQAAINGELRRYFSSGQFVAVKELEEVEACARRLLVLTGTARPEEENVKPVNGFSHLKEVIMSDNATGQEGNLEGNLKMADDISLENEVIMLESATEEGMQEEDMKQTSGVSHGSKEIVPATTNCWKGEAELLDCISNMSRSAEELRLGLDSLSKRVGDFFQIVLMGRDALLCNLRFSDVSKAAEVRS